MAHVLWTWITYIHYERYNDNPADRWGKLVILLGGTVQSPQFVPNKLPVQVTSSVVLSMFRQ